MTLDADSCYRALLARDARFDGVFYVGVTTTGVYCRPVCPARTPGRARCDFFTRAAEAERAGFRACFRCRPELAPGPASVDAVPRLVRAAVAKIEQGALNEGGVDELAASLGVTARHLRRAMENEIGVAPIELAQTKRLALAKQLLQDTSLSITDVAFASGFASLRRFNTAVRERFGRPPTKLRSTKTSPPDADAIVVRLDYREPFDWRRLLAFLGARAIPGVESVEGDRYQRSVAMGDVTGWCAARPSTRARSLRVEISMTLLPKLAAVVARLRALFDLDARPDLIAERLSVDPILRASVKARPGLRVPGAFDGFELAVRAILGQQVSVRGATTLAGRFAAKLGRPLAAAPPSTPLAFPSARDVAGASVAVIREIGVPESRARAIFDLAVAVAADEIDLAPGSDIAAACERLTELRGVGPWTASYVSMRALRNADAFLGGDLVVRRALGLETAREAEARAASWSPWRAYGVLHLWSMASEGETS